MALELEMKIMSEIGLGMPVRYFEGSGSCRYLAKSAGDRLSGVIAKHAEAGDEIAPPIIALVGLVGLAAETEPDQYTLRRTWQVASDVIRHHMEHYYEPKRDCCKRFKEWIENHYKLEKPRGFFYDPIGQRWEDWE